MRRLLAVALTLVVLLAGCTGGHTSVPAVEVSGPAGAAPTISYHVPLAVSGTSSEVVWEGTGAALQEGKPVLLDYWLENASTGEVVAESYSSSPKPYLLTQESIGADLYAALRGQKVGARILQVGPASDSGATKFSTVIVMDVLATRAVGKAIAPRDGLPTVTLDEDGAPTIVPTTAQPPSELTVQPLIKGAGEQVAKGAQVTIQYSEVDWATGAPVDSTWTTGLPVSFSLEVLGAWSQALVEQTVGSQVMVVVPPSFGLGGPAGSELQDATLVFVVDILAAAVPDATGASASPATPGATPSATPTS